MVLKTASAISSLVRQKWREALALKGAAVWCLQNTDPSTQFASLKHLIQTIILT